jgi:hypothetical protein
MAGEWLQGRPIYLFFDSLQRWTLLTTRALIGMDQGLLRSMRIDDMRSVGPKSRPSPDAPTEEVHRWKFSWEYLRVAGRQGVEAVVWVPCGNEALALWGILLPYIRNK